MRKRRGRPIHTGYAYYRLSTGFADPQSCKPHLLESRPRRSEHGYGWVLPKKNAIYEKKEN